MPSFLSSLCDEPSPLIVWNSSTSSFNVCFTKVAFFLPAHAILAGVSAYFVGALKGVAGDASGRSASRSFFIRFLCCICLFVLSIIHFFLPAFYKHAQGFPSTVDLAVFLVVAASWLLHGVALFRRRRHDSDAGIKMASDVAMTIAYLFVLIPQALEARRAVIYLISHSLSTSPLPHDATIATPLALAKSIMDIIVCVFHLIYITSLIIAFVVVRIKKSRLCHSSNADNEDLFQPEVQAGIFYEIFGWVYPLLPQKQIFQNNYVYPLPSSISISSLSCKLQEELAQSEVKNKDTKILGFNVHSSLLRALVNLFGTPYLFVGFLKLIVDVLAFSGPIILHALIALMENTSSPKCYGFLYALALLMTTSAGAILNAQFQFIVGKIQLQIRGALMTLIYERVLNWPRSAFVESDLSSGEIVNAISTDVDRIVNFCNTFHCTWAMMLQMTIALYLLHEQIYLAFFTGFFLALLFIPVNRFLCHKILVFSSAMMVHKDKRINLMAEILDGIHSIKLSGLELALHSRVEHHRRAELQNLKGIKYLDAAFVFFRATTPVMITLVSFFTYCYFYSSATLTNAKIFTSLTLFYILIEPLNMMPWVINGIADAWVSLNRVQRLLDIRCGHKKNNSKMITQNEALPLLVMSNASFSWSLLDNSSFYLYGLNLSVFPGTLVGVIGKVGAGKSSLLHAIIGEMRQEGGNVIRNWNPDTGIGFLPQKAWIYPGTFEENVLFGQVMDLTWYNTVLQACCLSEDVASFPQGNKTYVGQKGMLLSSGQKQRLALARAVYSKKSFYIMDCPFSALDRKIRQEIWKNVFVKLLCGASTIVMASHYGAEIFLKQESGYAVDWVIIMKDGKIKKQGRPLEFKNFVVEDQFVINKVMNEEKAIKFVNTPGFVAKDEVMERPETRMVGSHVYKAYWNNIGLKLSISILVVLFLMQLSKSWSDFWFSIWAEHISNVSDQKNLTFSMENFFFNGANFYFPFSLSSLIQSHSAYLLVIYGIISGLNIIITFIRAFLFAYGGLVAAQSLHDNIAERLFLAPLTFFERIPAGFVMNRFSSDLYSIDVSLPYYLNIFLAQAFGFAGVLIITCYSLPLFLTLLLPISAIYLYVQNFYRQTSPKIKRWASLTLSPIYDHYLSSLEGATTIRALRKQSQYVKKNLNLIHENVRAQYSQLIVTLCFNFSLKVIGIIIVFGASLVAIYENLNFSVSLVSPAFIGLALSHVLSVPGRLCGFVSSFAAMEKEMISLERIIDYNSKIPVEEDVSDFPLFQICSLRLTRPVIFNDLWPLSGVVIFENVTFSYASGKRMALDHVSFTAAAGETIGICGRTGSGKSSLLAAMLRTHPLSSGRILIDGIDVKEIPLHILRQWIAIVPQNPLLFIGTIRENLMPESIATEANKTKENEDKDLRNLLIHYQLWELVASLGGLDAPLCPASFSAGQKQLLCLVRVMRCRPKILCLDEATASIDLGTDHLLQMVIRKNCKGQTLLVISHRVNELGDFDKVLVMKDGKMEKLKRKPTKREK